MTSDPSISISSLLTTNMSHNKSPTVWTVSVEDTKRQCGLPLSGGDLRGSGLFSVTSIAKCDEKGGNKEGKNYNPVSECR